MLGLRRHTGLLHAPCRHLHDLGSAGKRARRSGRWRYEAAADEGDGGDQGDAAGDSAVGITEMSEEGGDGEDETNRVARQSGRARQQPKLAAAAKRSSGNGGTTDSPLKNRPNHYRQAAFEGDIVHAKPKPTMGLAGGEEGIVETVSRRRNALDKAFVEYEVRFGDRVLPLLANEFKCYRRGKGKGSATPGHHSGGEAAGAGASAAQSQHASDEEGDADDDDDAADPNFMPAVAASGSGSASGSGDGGGHATYGAPVLNSLVSL